MISLSIEMPRSDITIISRWPYSTKPSLFFLWMRSVTWLFAIIKGIQRVKLTIAFHPQSWWLATRTSKKKQHSPHYNKNNDVIKKKLAAYWSSACQSLDMFSFYTSFKTYINFSPVLKYLVNCDFKLWQNSTPSDWNLC